MNQNQKMLLGAAVVGFAGYLYWKSKQPKAAFAAVKNFSDNPQVANKNPKIAGPVVGTGKPGTFAKNPKAGFAVKNTMPQQSSTWVRAEGSASKHDAVAVKKGGGFFAPRQANSWVRPVNA